jgi:hypothetical protein
MTSDCQQVADGQWCSNFEALASTVTRSTDHNAAAAQSNNTDLLGIAAQTQREEQFTDWP